MWEIDAVLSTPSGSLDATCNDGLTLEADTFVADVNCELDNGPITLLEGGQYCWDVTVTETGANYGTDGDGIYLGLLDANNECFDIKPYAGCTPGFWKNNADKHGYSAWPEEGISMIHFEAIFEAIEIKGNDNPTLEEALAAKGGNLNQLARHGVAAWLNSIDDDVLYPYTEAEVIVKVVQGINDKDFIKLNAGMLADANELGCSQNQQGDFIEFQPPQ
jgi:hypothetical protein